MGKQNPATKLHGDKLSWSINIEGQIHTEQEWGGDQGCWNVELGHGRWREERRGRKEKCQPSPEPHLGSWATVTQASSKQCLWLFRELDRSDCSNPETKWQKSRTKYNIKSYKMKEILVWIPFQELTFSECCCHVPGLLVFPVHYFIFSTTCKVRLFACLFFYANKLREFKNITRSFKRKKITRKYYLIPVGMVIIIKKRNNMYWWGYEEKEIPCVLLMGM